MVEYSNRSVAKLELTSWSWIRPMSFEYVSLGNAKIHASNVRRATGRPSPPGNSPGEFNSQQDPSTSAPP